jgi:hypothetical protein
MAVYIVAIHGFVATLVGLHHGSVQAHSNENALAARIRQNFRVSLRSVPAAAFRPTGPAATEASAPSLNLSLSRLCKGVIVHKEHHEVGGRASDLITHAPAVNSHKHGGAPAMPGATGCQSPAVAAAEYKGELHVSWNDGDTFRRFQQILRNALIRGVHDFLENLGSFVGALNIILAVRGDSS